LQKGVQLVSSRKIQRLAFIVGANIANRRRAIGLTQDQLAEKLNISGASLSRIESGMAAPRFPRLEQLAEILFCHVTDLFRKESDPLSVKLDTVEDMLRTLPVSTQEDLVYLMITAIQTVKKNRLEPQ
jgi:transcriptional regulator with XRE-family HTH domain